MKTFNIDKFKDKIIEIVENLIKETPDEWKTDIAGFISIQAIIFGADNVFEGVGILEMNKQEYINICNEVLNEDEISTGLN